MTTQLSTLLQDALGPDHRIEQELAGGGMSRLFLATDVRHNRRVVVKVLAPELVTPDSTARFKREIELTVRLQHPHILPVLTSGAWEDVLYYITPFIPGESLRERIGRDHKLPLADVLRILRELSGALAFAHQRGIVHRDVKPANVLISEGHAILADFGIARAVVTSTTANPLTGSGMTPGTPAYMAPELPTDEKADIYALGVVAYEMLCGQLPPRGVSAKQIVADRGMVAGDSRERLRGLAELIADMVTPSVERRLALATAVSEQVERLVQARSSPKWIIPAAIAAVVLAVAATLTLMKSRPNLDADRYVVLGLGASDSITAPIAGRVSDALGEWQGINVADPNVVATAVGKVSRGPFLLGDASSIARSLKARNLVAVESKVESDSIVVRASLYDAGNDSSMRAKRVAIGLPVDAAVRAMEIRRLVNGLVRDGSELPWRTSADRAPPVLAAWRSYDAGRAALNRWDLAAAEQAFRAAIAADAKIAQAHLWLARTIVWNRRVSAPESRASARRALDLAARLDPRDSVHATAMLALTEGRYPAACGTFRQLIATDSTDLPAWLGAGDCASQDKEVVRDDRSPTHWAFRGSFESAARAYRRAGEIGPAAEGSEFQGWLLGRLAYVLYTTTNHFRVGFTATPDTTRFVSFSQLDHDTLAFSPYETRFLSDARYDPPPARVQAAIDRNRELIRRHAEEWVRRAPANAAAYDSLASATELAGGLAQIGDRQLTTLDVLKRARTLARGDIEPLRIAVAEVRNLIKAERFADARALADSLLRSGAAAHNAEIDGLPGLAVVVGNPAQVAQLLPRTRGSLWLQMPGGANAVPPPQIMEVAARVHAYAMLGVHLDSIARLAEQTVALSASYYADTAAASAVRNATLATSLILAYPDGREVLTRIDPANDLNARLFIALARGDTASARNQLLVLQRRRQGRAGGLSIDLDYARARLAMMLGDTTAAIAELDPFLRALPTIASSVLARPSQIASLVRAFALRAEIADRRGDRELASKYASAVVALWSNADSNLQPLVQRMKVLSKHAP